MDVRHKETVPSDETEVNRCGSKLCHTNDRSVGRLSFKFLSMLHYASSLASYFSQVI